MSGGTRPAADLDRVMSGFPPAPQDRVTLATWQEPPYLRWAFRHLREVIPSQAILAADRPEPLTGPPAGGAGAARLARAAATLGELPVVRLDGTTGTVDEVVADTWTDALLVVHDGRLVHERYLDGMTARTPHLLMSVSKSLVGCVAARLAARGDLDVDAPAERWVPELEGSGYEGVTVRQLLDMRTGVAFSEAYTSPDAEVRVMERSMGWRPPLDADPVGLCRYLTTLGVGGEHGGPFHYRSADTDVLGWVAERAAGHRMADLLSSLLWRPLGAEHDAEVTCDAVGSAVHDGGVSATARDVARFGRMLLDGGRVGEREVVPAAWLRDAWRPPDDVREAFAASDNDAVLPGGWYRSQLWFVPGRNGVVLLCLGIHGQLVCVDRATRTVVVKLSSWPTAQDTAHLVDTIRACGAIGAHLAAAG